MASFTIFVDLLRGRLPSRRSSPRISAISCWSPGAGLLGDLLAVSSVTMLTLLLLAAPRPLLLWKMDHSGGPRSGSRWWKVGSSTPPSGKLEAGILGGPW